MCVLQKFKKKDDHKRLLLWLSKYEVTTVAQLVQQDAEAMGW